MKLDASSIKFHTVHRVGKKVQERTRPIIVRFVSREDRNAVWAKGDKIKQSDVHTDAYITEDFARAIQEERKVLHTYIHTLLLPPQWGFSGTIT